MKNFRRKALVGLELYRAKALALNRIRFHCKLTALPHRHQRCARTPSYTRVWSSRASDLLRGVRRERDRKGDGPARRDEPKLAQRRLLQQRGGVGNLARDRVDTRGRDAHGRDQKEDHLAAAKVNARTSSGERSAASG